LLKDHLGLTGDVPAQDYFKRLNNVRVGLKHHGITPDKEQWGSVAEKAFEAIAEWCTTYLKVDYAELDAAELISAAPVREIVLSARQYLHDGHFKECLEKLAQGLGKSRYHIAIGLPSFGGEANAETALALSGYGVDPGRYIALQRLLPQNARVQDFLGFQPRWDKRQYGHEANWTQENAEFAYQETVNLLTRMQQANPYPSPAPFYDVFRDVLVVKIRSQRQAHINSRSTTLPAACARSISTLMTARPPS
jgi:hypothetical protein